MRIDERPKFRSGWMGLALAIGTVLLGMGISGVAEAQKDKIRLAAQVWYPSFPQYVAQEMGFYAKWGLDPTIKVYASGAPIVQAAATAEWDVAHIGLPPTVQGFKLGLIIAAVISEEAVNRHAKSAPGACPIA